MNGSEPTGATTTPRTAEAAPRRVAVAASGGRDSTALLHATQRAARLHGIEIHALHVHHGLHADADAWLDHVRGQCRRWGIHFHCQRVPGQPGRGDSVEAWARRARMLALQSMAVAAGCQLLLLAQHRRDQAETWLLQGLRGGGAAGLAAMPAQSLRDGIVWARPWLQQPREAIEAYARRHRLKSVDDGSNADPRYARNRLRLQLWPTLLRAFPDAEVSFGAAADQSAHAAALAKECAAQDLPALRSNDSLQVAPWLALPLARRRNALAHWLAGLLPGGVPLSLVQRLMQEVPATPSARWPAPDGELRLYRGLLRLVSGAAPIDAAIHWVDLSGSEPTRLEGWPGHIRSVAVQHGGMALSQLSRLEVRPRAGAERFKLAPKAAARALKLQFQACGVAAWDRSGPLLYTLEGRLVFVAGLGIDGDAQAAPGEPQRSLCWVPDAAR